MSLVPTTCAGAGWPAASASVHAMTWPSASAGSGWRVPSQSAQAGAGASSPVTPASKASVNWLTMRCDRRCSGGSASLALASSAARSPVVIATLASGSTM
ncbi:hypothetical protein D3C71_551010 [compost metagenome]